MTGAEMAAGAKQLGLPAGRLHLRGRADALSEVSAIAIFNAR
jgi:hypothetical protein